MRGESIKQDVLEVAALPERAGGKPAPAEDMRGVVCGGALGTDFGENSMP